TARRYTSDRTQAKLSRWLTLSRAFDAWDRFDHARADRLLGAAPDGLAEYRTFLSVLQGHRGHGFELVEDLLRNAERRAAQSHYDDAVGRLYRAIELTAQVWLRERHRIDTSCVDLERVPETQRDKLFQLRDRQNKAIKVGLLTAWDLIAAFPDDPLGVQFLPRRAKLLQFLSHRNNSLLAHGIRPVSESDYRSQVEFVENFLTDAIERAIDTLQARRIVTLPQFPTSFD
ncbi:MAG TPA: TIGR02710 family CRISPR-associated protein, partial [Planctomycetaceae bacterium]|nr:TIGR02710 family CRISPR-associated protein [Planctomycetaceae bacterium]